MDTFHPFPRLPYDIRALIWKSAVGPRVVQLSAHYEKRLTRPHHQHCQHTWEIEYLLSTTPVPALLHTCRESRHQNLYEKMFYLDASEPRHIWVNFKLDIIDVGYGSNLDILKHNGSRVRRLKFEADNYEEHWFHSASRDLVWFKNMVEYHVVAGGGVGAWWGAWEDFTWTCKRENLKFIDKQTGMIMNSYEVDKMMDDIQANDWQQAEEEERLAAEMAAATTDIE